VSVSEEIRASAAAHRDLGPGYESAVAEGLVERIGEEIDRRIDARLYGQVRSFPQQPRPPKQRNTSGVGFWGAVLAIVSMALAVGASAVILHTGGQGNGSGGAECLTAFVWVVIGAINISYARRRLCTV
jgi:hypothetical protein